MIFLVDTSVMTSGRFRRLLEASASNGHTVEVPALVYAERVFQLRRQKEADFNIADIRGWFERFPSTLALQVLDEVTAESLAAALYTRFPNDDAWLAAKRAVWRRCLGQQVIEEPGAHRACGGPVDAYIVGLASPERPVVTADGGPEWEGVPAGTVLRYAEALQRAGTP
jgi:predicted nucleic acid-binding protein